MSRKKELQRSLGNRYSYERLLSDREIQKLRREIPADFSETVAAVLTVGCLRLSESLSEPVRLKEADMLRILDRMVSEHGLSYTESCFDRLDGKAVRKEKPAL